VSPLLDRSQPLPVSATHSASTETAGGIIIPDQYQSKVNEGEVLAVGPGARDKDVSSRH